MIIIGQQPLSIDEIIQVARKDEIVKLGDNALALIQDSNIRLEKIIESDQPVYGINTGFGIFADKKIQKNEINKLNRNLILSHAVGVGEPLSDEIVRAAMIVRANTLAKGYSGVRLELINTLVEAINRKVTPIVPSQGSLGSSGDLCPLSHMALVLTTDENNFEAESGTAKYKNNVYSGKKAMELAGISRHLLGPKEGLALNNGATFSAAMAAISELTLHPFQVSCTTTNRWVFWIEAKNFVSSSGSTVRRSIISTLTPCAANFSAACRQKVAIYEYVTIVTSVPSRMMDDSPNGMIYSSSGTGPLTP